MGSIGGAAMIADAAADEEACTYAMQLAAASILPMTLKNAIELGMLESLVAAGGNAGKALSPSEVVARLPSTAANPDAPAMVDRMLRLLASYNVVSCEEEEGKDGLLARRYGPAPVCKWLTPNKDGVSMAALVLMNDKVIMESWNGAQKLVGILIAIGEAVAYVLPGMYGSVGQLGTRNAILIILQLFFAGIIVVYTTYVKSFNSLKSHTARWKFNTYVSIFY